MVRLHCVFLSLFLLPFFPFHTPLLRSSSLTLLSICFSRGAYNSAILSNLSLSLFKCIFFFSFLLLVLAYPLAFTLFARAIPNCVLLLNSQCVNTYGAHCSHKICYPDGISLKIPLCVFSCVVFVCVCASSNMECELLNRLAKHTRKYHTHINGHVSSVSLSGLNKCGIEQQFN